MNEMMTGVQLEDLKVGIQLVTIPQAHIQLEVSILVP